ncbi:caspase family protein [uncultured Alsobacter sp.]|uniref:caspase family protein n=1 Tax=uncultured Alsobacter sp. TaxID=1748258 RepID=UPI0025CC320C|nr:caspase family protein [uncultured Alsobacter sp.]
MVRYAVLFVLVALGLATPAFAERKVALLIGNSAYSSVAPLRNPANDVALMARTLRDAGFDVVETALDLDDRGMRQALRRFEDKAADADVGVVFYSGHGIEMNGQNYLVPVNARLAADADVKDEAIPLDRVLEAVERVKRLKLVILDACRDNPFIATMQRSAGQRSAGRGFARVEPAATGTLIAYAAKAGTTAADGTGANSPFTIALAKHVARPGVDIRLALGTVRDEVLAATGQKQEPFVYGSLGGSTLTLGPLEPPKAAAPPPPAVAAVPAPGPAPDACGYAGAHWGQAEKLDRVELYEEHLKLFPTCPFASFARIRIAEKTAPASQKVASLPQAVPPPTALPPTVPTPAPPAQRSLSEGELVRSVQLELQRVGCEPGKVDGSWNAQTRSALTRFNTFAKTTLDTKAISEEALAALRGRDERVCPLACATGLRASGDQCVPVVCGPGQQLSPRGACVAVPQTAPKPAPTAKAAPEPAPAQAAEPARTTGGGAAGVYDTPQAGMTCNRFGGGGAFNGGQPQRPVYWCK